MDLVRSLASVLKIINSSFAVGVVCDLMVPLTLGAILSSRYIQL